MGSGPGRQPIVVECSSHVFGPEENEVPNAHSSVDLYPRIEALLCA